MTDPLITKAPEVQDVVSRLTSDLGPERVAVANEPSGDPESVTITLRSDPSRMVFISTSGMGEGRYTVSYDQLQTKRTGDTSIEQQTSSGVVYEGLRWIARKIFDDGIVTGEFDKLPDRKRIRR